MLSSTGVVVHPRRWQWVLAKCAIVMDMMAVGALIVVMLIRAVLLMLPFQLPEQFGWVAWYLAAFAALTVQLAAIALQVVLSTVLVSGVPGTAPGTWREQIVTVIRVREIQLMVLAYGGMSVGALVHSHAGHPAAVVAAVIPFLVSLNAFKLLLDDVRTEEPLRKHPSIIDPRVGLAYDPSPEFVGSFWYDPAQIRTLSTAKACLSMVEQARVVRWAVHGTTLVISAVVVREVTGAETWADSFWLLGAVVATSLVSHVADGHTELRDLRRRYRECVIRLEREAVE